MTNELKKSDCTILEHLAEYRIFTMSQLAIVCRKNKPVVRKRIRDLKRKDL